MLTVLSILGVLAVLFVAAAVATREGPILADAPGDVADLGLPEGPLQPEDLQAVRFGLAVRGYRMAEVDTVLDRVAKELADRDRQLAASSGSSAKLDPTSVAVPVAVATKVADQPGGAAVEKPAASASAESMVPKKVPVVPVEPPLDSPPPPAEEPADAEAQEAVEAAAPADEHSDAGEPLTEGESDGSTEQSTGAAADVVPGTGTPATSSSVATDSTAAASSADASADSGDDVLPPEPPPLDVAAVRTEIAPIPDSAAPPAADADSSAEDTAGPEPVDSKRV